MVRRPDPPWNDWSAALLGVPGRDPLASHRTRPLDARRRQAAANGSSCSAPKASADCSRPKRARRSSASSSSAGCRTGRHARIPIASGDLANDRFRDHVWLALLGGRRAGPRGRARDRGELRLAVRARPLLRRRAAAALARRPKLRAHRGSETCRARRPHLWWISMPRRQRRRAPSRDRRPTQRAVARVCSGRSRPSTPLRLRGKRRRAPYSGTRRRTRGPGRLRVRCGVVASAGGRHWSAPSAPPRLRHGRTTPRTRRRAQAEPERRATATATATTRAREADRASKRWPRAGRRRLRATSPAATGTWTAGGE